MTSVDTMVTCPNCGAQAAVRIVYRDVGGPTDIRDFDCPNGCKVDKEAIRQIIGTSGN